MPLMSLMHSLVISATAQDSTKKANWQLAGLRLVVRCQAYWPGSTCHNRGIDPSLESTAQLRLATSCPALLCPAKARDNFVDEEVCHRIACGRPPFSD